MQVCLDDAMLKGVEMGTYIITCSRGTWWLDRREAIQRKEGHLRHGQGWVNRLGSCQSEWRSAGAQAIFLPGAKSSGSGFSYGARRSCREALTGGGSPHPCQRRIVACWRTATRHHAARGRWTLLDPGLMGLRTGPALLVITRKRHRARQPERVGGGWRMEEKDTEAGRWTTAAPVLDARGGLERLVWQVRMAGRRG